MELLADLQKNILLFDGAMGTMLQGRGLPVGMAPEYFNLSHPDIVTEIHREYVEAGADLITTNTFQANASKIAPEEVEPIITAAVKIAKAAGPKYVALDIGPIGKLMAPMGTLTFDEAYEMFRQQAVAGEKAGADVILLETMADLLEVKAAVLAVKEHTQLPIFATLTYQEDGRTFVGADPITATLTLQSLGVDAVGVNCSLGPKELLPIVKQIIQYAQIPVMVQANAGLPDMEDGKTVYRITTEEYTDATSEMLQLGVKIVGGCCGTNPAFIRSLREKIQTFPQVVTKPMKVTAVTSGSQTVVMNQKLSVIGERINPTGKPRLKEALRKEDLSYIVGEAIDQQNAGADILDVNVGLPELDESLMMRKVVEELQSVTPLPLQIDSSDVRAIETGARYYNGRPLINSVNGKPETMAKIFPIVKKYGGVILGLALDEKGIPATAEERFAIAKRIVETAAEYGIPKEDVLIDPLVLTASAQQEQVMVTLETIRLVKARLGLLTVVGLSNVSFGLPNRGLLNANFLAAAFGAGLDAPIMNPLSEVMMETVKTLRVINYQDKEASEYIQMNLAKENKVSGTSTATDDKVDLDLKEIILQGRKDEAPGKTKELLQTMTPLAIVNQFFIPALDEVGSRFEKGTLFLPQLMQSAETVKQAQQVLKDWFAANGEVSEVKGRLILATVEGDIHDIGKNIVKMILENYGYEVIDLGKDVPVEKVVEVAVKEKVTLIGLSALMTTTVQNMKRTIAAVKEAGLDCTFMVGGAVLNEEYREFVGADYYAKDALDSVTIAQKVFGK